MFDAAIVFAPIDEVTDTAIKSIKKGGTVVIATVGKIPNFLALKGKKNQGHFDRFTKGYGRCD
ncbi:MAG: hypothetical protein CM1200mP23_2710 [Nitrososphaerota archaeon]|nr:MAG: hypothetical protein CM1200mP23_2710 [Nitrososphaerota archaeon]